MYARPVGTLRCLLCLFLPRTLGKYTFKLKNTSLVTLGRENEEDSRVSEAVKEDIPLHNSWISTAWWSLVCLLIETSEGK